MSTYYTYHIFHPITNKHYYGVRYAKGCHPSDLWTRYFTSSKKIEQLINEYGKESFIVRIRRIFNNPTEALLWERRVLNRLKVNKSEKWLNENIGGRIAITEEIKKKVSLKLKGVPKSEEHRKKIAIARKGTKRSLETRLKIKEARSKQVITPESIKKGVESRKGYKHSEEIKQKIAESVKKSWEIRHLQN